MRASLILLEDSSPSKIIVNMQGIVNYVKVCYGILSIVQRNGKVWAGGAEWGRLILGVILAPKLIARHDTSLSTT